MLVAGADTFRAAAGEQLKEWADRCGVDMIGGQEGSDPSAVVFDAVAAAKARKCDVLLIDTAGRLHNKKNLMEELRKMNHVISRNSRKLTGRRWRFWMAPPVRTRWFRPGNLRR